MRAKKSESRGAARAVVDGIWAENASHLNILEHELGYEGDTAKAKLLNVGATTVWRISQGASDCAGLSEVILKALFGGVSGIAYAAQMQEHLLRRAHCSFASLIAAGEMGCEQIPDAMKKIIGDADRRHTQLWTHYNRFRPARTPDETYDDTVDKVALDSLEGHIATYTRDYKHGFDCFDRALSYFGSDLPVEFGPQLLLVRATANLFFTADKNGIDVCRRVAGRDSVRLAQTVVKVTRDIRPLLNLAEALVKLGKMDEAAELLCDALEIMKINPAALGDYHPIGFEKKLSAIAELEPALSLVPDVAERRKALAKEMKALSEIGYL